jgi:hypothetical protein
VFIPFSDQPSGELPWSITESFEQITTSLCQSLSLQFYNFVMQLADLSGCNLDAVHQSTSIEGLADHLNPLLQLILILS